MELQMGSVSPPVVFVKTEGLSFPEDNNHSKKLSCEVIKNVRKENVSRNVALDNGTKHSIYNLMCPWDYLVNFSNVSSSTNTKSPTLCNIRIQSLINNFELLINQFKHLIGKSCSLHTAPSEKEDKISKNNNENVINLTDNLSVLLGYTQKMPLRLDVTDSNKIADEYIRCCNVLDTVIDTITYKDLEETSCVIDESHLGNVKAEFGIDADEDDGYNVTKDNEIIQHSFLDCKDKTQNKSVKSNLKSTVAKVRPYEPLGYKSEFCIDEQEYNDLINHGSPYNCPSCRKAFKDRRNLEHHLNGRCLGVPAKDMEWEPKWKKEGGRLHCQHPGCSETYTHKQSLYKHHQRAHLKDAVNLPYKCDKCNKSFIIKSILSIHIQEMHKEKIRKCCEICGASVRSNTDLKLHMRRRHTGEMPFKCEYCDFRGVNISSVKRHTKLKHETHLLTFHCCDICGKQFKTKANLKEHIPTHSDKRTFLCKICGKCLKNDCSYRRHMVCVHGIKYTCELCGKDYSAVIGLKVHQRNVHGINS